MYVWYTMVCTDNVIQQYIETQDEQKNKKRSKKYILFKLMVDLISRIKLEVNKECFGLQFHVIQMKQHTRAHIYNINIIEYIIPSSVSSVSLYIYGMLSGLALNFGEKL